MSLSYSCAVKATLIPVRAEIYKSVAFGYAANQEKKKWEHHGWNTCYFSFNI